MNAKSFFSKVAAVVAAAALTIVRAGEETPQKRHERAIQRIGEYQGTDKSDLEDPRGKTIYIQGAENDADLLLVGELHGVTNLVIFPYVDNVTNAGFAFLAKQRELEFLEIAIRVDNVDDGILKYVENLPKLKEFMWSDINLTDRGVASLCKVKSLEHLFLEQECISVEGMRMLQGLPNLYELDLGRSLKEVKNFDDYDDFTGLAKLSELEVLSLHGAKVRGQDLAQLKTLKHLRSLRLPNATIEGSLESLQELRHLSELDLSGSNVSDQDMLALARHPNLSRLVLNGCNVTDKGLTDLVNKKIVPNWQWTELQIAGTKVTEAGLLSLDADCFWRMKQLTVDYKAISDATINRLKEKGQGHMNVEKLFYQKQ